MKQKLNIVLFGKGKMGQLIAEQALSQGHHVMAMVGRSFPNGFTKILPQADIFIDFSSASSLISHINWALEFKKPILIGTTGWEANRQDIFFSVEKEKGSLLYAPNFSLGIALFNKLVQKSVELLGTQTDYDVSLFEAHHSQKMDAPSGTALHLAETILSKHPIKTQWTQTTSSDSSYLQVSSMRCGAIPGTHTILFDSPCDTIELTHKARNRNGFAQGALMAAGWLMGKKGIYTFENCIDSMLHGSKSYNQVD